MPRKLDEGWIILYAKENDVTEAAVRIAEQEIIEEVGNLKYWLMSPQQRRERLMEKLRPAS